MDLQKLMRDAQKMQQNLSNIGQELDETEYTGTSNGVTIKVNGKSECLLVEIPEDMLTDREMLQDVIMIAFNDATSKAAQDREQRLDEATQNMALLGM